MERILFHFEHHTATVEFGLVTSLCLGTSSGTTKTHYQATNEEPFSDSVHIQNRIQCTSVVIGNKTTHYLLVFIDAKASFSVLKFD